MVMRTLAKSQPDRARTLMHTRKAPFVSGLPFKPRPERTLEDACTALQELGESERKKLRFRTTSRTEGTKAAEDEAA